MAEIYKLGSILLLLLLLFDIITASSSQWFKIFVEKSIIGNRNNLKEIEETISTTSSVFIIPFLSRLGWPVLGCLLSPTQLLVSAGKISPYYKNSTEDSYVCYTRLVKDLVFGSSLDGTKKWKDYAAHGGKNETNLARGLYVGTLDHCCFYLSRSHPLWLLIDFGEPKAFDTVVLETLVHDVKALLPSAGDVWFGNSPPTTIGDFSNFNLFASFPKFKSGQMMELKRTDKKIKAQYVGIKLNKGHVFYFCSVQIYQS